MEGALIAGIGLTGFGVLWTGQVLLWERNPEEEKTEIRRFVSTGDRMIELLIGLGSFIFGGVLLANHYGVLP